MSKQFMRFGIVLIASFLFMLSAELPAGPMAGNNPVVVLGYEVSGNQIAVTMSNPGSSHRHGTLVLLVSLDDDTVEQVTVAYSLNAGSTATYTTSFDSDVTGATGIIDDNNPM